MTADHYQLLAEQMAAVATSLGEVREEVARLSEAQRLRETAPGSSRGWLQTAAAWTAAVAALYTVFHH